MYMCVNEHTLYSDLFTIMIIIFEILYKVARLVCERVDCANNEFNKDRNLTLSYNLMNILPEYYVLEHNILSILGSIAECIPSAQEVSLFHWTVL